jgi:hypothetical protein
MFVTLKFASECSRNPDPLWSSASEALSSVQFKSSPRALYCVGKFSGLRDNVHRPRWTICPRHLSTSPCLHPGTTAARQRSGTMTFREGNVILFKEGRSSFVQCLKYSSASSLCIHYLSRWSCRNWKALAPGKVVPLPRGYEDRKEGRPEERNMNE